MAKRADRYETWDPDHVYVIGHQRPDTDAIASALGYAWLLGETGHPEAVPARAGQAGAQALFALERFGVAAPPSLSLAAPLFGHVAEMHETLAPESTVGAALAILAAGARVAPIVDAERRPLGVVTAMALARAYAGSLGPGRKPAAELTCGEILEAAPVFEDREHISDHRRGLLRSEADDFLITDPTGGYAGVATRAGVLEPPRCRLILVDHNELSQAVTGADQAEVVAVLDHHRLGNPPTAAPIPFMVEPVGSTCTLVAEMCRRADLTPPGGLAGVMLSGVLSDTLLFRSPTTTSRDREAAEWLAALAGVDPLVYGDELLRAAPGLAGRPAGEILDADRKTYDFGGEGVSLAQVEVTGFQELSGVQPDLLSALEERRRAERLSLACLMVTDVVAGRSRLVAAGESRLLAALPFPRAGEREWDLGEMVSRKKQLVPALHSVLAPSE